MLFKNSVRRPNNQTVRCNEGSTRDLSLPHTGLAAHHARWQAAHDGACANFIRGSNDDLDDILGPGAATQFGGVCLPQAILRTVGARERIGRGAVDPCAFCTRKARTYIATARTFRLTFASIDHLLCAFVGIVTDTSPECTCCASPLYTGECASEITSSTTLKWTLRVQSKPPVFSGQ